MAAERSPTMNWTRPELRAGPRRLARRQAMSWWRTGGAELRELNALEPWQLRRREVGRTLAKEPVRGGWRDSPSSWRTYNPSYVSYGLGGARA
jgi:hypothetical protein